MALEKAILVNSVTGARTPVLFNPEEYTQDRSVNYAQAAIPGLSAPLLQFVAGAMQTLTMELLLDTLEAHSAAGTSAGDDVRVLVERVTGLMNIDPSTHAPPPVLFVWGTSLTFTCVVSRVSQRFIMFAPDGTPLRARLQVTFDEYLDVELEAKEIKRETVDYSKRVILGQGETLSNVAARTYADPTLWRPIAIRNGIDDPRSLPVGLELTIPPLPYRDPDSGEVYA